MSSLAVIVLCLSLPACLAAPLLNWGLGPVPQQSETAMLRMLDSMQQLMSGSGDGKFDRRFYIELRACMAHFDLRLPSAQDKAWQGIIDYWDMGGTQSDPWGGTPTNYSEHNITVTTLHGMTIYEPCDYASNVAYYHDVTEFCYRKMAGEPFAFSEDYVNALGKAFSALAMGSSFMHGTNTLLGRQQDRQTLAVVAYLIHQGSLSSLSSKSPILHDLSDVPRDRTALKLVEDFLTMYLTQPVTEWSAITDSFDIPQYMLSFAGIFSTVLTLGFDPETVDLLLPTLANAFGLPDQMKSFILDQYIPEIRKATSHQPIGMVEQAHFLGNAIGPVIKLIYAFLWQERVLTKSKIFLDPVVNFIGWELLPRVNHIANQFTNYQHFDVEFQNGTNIYPGGDWCNPVIPHAKWHLESGIGMLDLTYLANEMCRLISSRDLILE